ncbi:MAG: bifunctional YncE family protein/alkaline phosphatase family protein [Chthoniobacterales bacterium]
MARTLGLAALLAGGIGSLSAVRATPRIMGEQADGSVLVPTNQTVTPIGLVRRIEGDRPKDLALSPDGKILAVLAKTEVHFFLPDGSPLTNVKLNAGPLGLAWTPNSQTLFASGDNGEIYRLEADPAGAWKIVHCFFISEIREDRSKTRHNTNYPKPFGPAAQAPEEPRIETTSQRREHEGNPQVTGLDISADGKRLFAALGVLNEVVVIDVASDKIITTVGVGIAPYRVAASPDGETLFVANRGGRLPRGKEPRAFSAGSALRIDPATDAALRGSISIIQTERLTSTEIDAGRQPSGLAVTADGAGLYVANSDDDTVELIDTKTRQVQKTLSLTPALDPGFGQMPTDLALSEDGKFLYVTCGGSNAVAVVALPEFKISGYLPTGWFPIAIAEHGGTLFVASSKGLGARLRSPGPKATPRGDIGLVQFIGPTDNAALVPLSARVAANNHWQTSEPPARPAAKAVPVPERVGEPSVFRHVVYIIKENHTYDIDLGDLPEGNGDPALCLFGEKITPNEHALARQFVLLDNTYASGSNSADGHQWTDAALANAYVEQNYNAYARGYPYAGGDPLAASPAGFIWDAALRAGKSLRVYGEFVNQPRVFDPTTGKTPGWREVWADYQAGGHKYVIKAETSNAVLKAHLQPQYIGFPLIVPDQWRADLFLSELKAFGRTDSLPALSIMLLPCDHTAGTRPDMPTPRAMVADNDLALGRIIDGISHSRFWKDTLVLVIEDDSRFGLDHVDGHRTLAFCVSPYTRRGAVVSEPYNHTSLIRTIGLVLGLPALNRFDRTATPLTACFTDQPDLRPFGHLPNEQPLDEMNPPLAAVRGVGRQLAAASQRLDISRPDRADPTILARAAWEADRPRQPFPRANFNPDFSDDD